MRSAPGNAPHPVRSAIPRRWGEGADEGGCEGVHKGSAGDGRGRRERSCIGRQLPPPLPSSPPLKPTAASLRAIPKDGIAEMRSESKPPPISTASVSTTSLSTSLSLSSSLSASAVSKSCGGELLKVTLLPNGRARLRGTSAEAGMELRLEPRIGWMVGDVLGGLGSVLSGSCTWCGRSMDISKKSCGVVAGSFATDGRTRGVDCTSVVTPSTRSSRSRAPEKVVGVSGIGAGAHGGARAGAVGGGSLRCSTGCCSLRCRAMVRSTQVSSFSTPSPCSARSSPLSAVHIGCRVNWL